MYCIKCGSPTTGNEELCINCAYSPEELEIIDFPEDIVDIIDIYPTDGVTVDNFIDTISDKLENTEGIIDIPEIIGQTIEEIKNKRSNKKTKKEKKSNNNPKIEPELIITITLLIVSVCTNAFLIINSGNNLAKNSPKNKTEQQIQTTAYSRYNFEMPLDWITSEKNGQLMIYDKTENWAASVKIVDNVEYDTFVSNKDTFPKDMATAKYQFTSSYTKEVNNIKNYLFKGKYHDYSVYVIVTELPNHTIAVTDLKFKEEVSDVILNDIIKAIGTINQRNDNIFTNNFEFNDLTDIVTGVSQNNQ